MKLSHSKGFLFPVVLGLVATGALVGPGATPSQATTVVSSDPFAGPYEIQARARRGGPEVEAALLTPGNPSPTAVPLNPTGAPVWVFGQPYDFKFLYSYATGTTNYSIDFNRDGDFLDPQETATSLSLSLAGDSFVYTGIFVQGSSINRALWPSGRYTSRGALRRYLRPVCRHPGHWIVYIHWNQFRLAGSPKVLAPSWRATSGAWPPSCARSRGGLLVQPSDSSSYQRGIRLRAESLIAATTTPPSAASPLKGAFCW
jgi:hypothetical protein